MQFKRAMKSMNLSEAELYDAIYALHKVCSNVLRNYLHITDEVLFEVDKCTSSNSNKITYGYVTYYQGYKGIQTLTLFLKAFKANRYSLIYSSSVIRYQLDSIVDTILHEYCHIFQNQNDTYKNSKEYFLQSRNSAEIAFKEYKNLPWEIEARDFVKTFRKTSEYSKIQEAVNRLFNEYSKLKSPSVTSKGQFTFKDKDYSDSLALAA